MTRSRRMVLVAALLLAAVAGAEGAKKNLPWWWPGPLPLPPGGCAQGQLVLNCPNTLIWMTNKVLSP